MELAAQLQAFRALMDTQPTQGTGEPPASGVSASCPLDVECLNVDVTADELHTCTCIKRFKRGKIPGIDGGLAQMIKEGADLLESCLLLLLNRMLASHLPERLSVGIFLNMKIFTVV